MDLILCRSTKGCQGVALSTLCKDFFNKVSDKLLGPYTSLMQAVLSSAAGRTRSCPRSLSLTLLKKSLQKVDQVTPWHPLVVRRKIKSKNLNVGQPLLLAFWENQSPSSQSGPIYILHVCTYLSKVVCTQKWLVLGFSSLDQHFLVHLLF